MLDFSRGRANPTAVHEVHEIDELNQYISSAIASQSANEESTKKLNGLPASRSLPRRKGAQRSGISFTARRNHPRAGFDSSFFV
jgi:hypothetical protein